MKVLYIGHYREGSGWGQAAIDNIRALNKVGVDVVCRNVALTKVLDIPKDIEECERKECYDATHCIQHVLPHLFVGSDRYVKNIGYFVSETAGTRNINWNNYLQLVDKLWVPNESMAYELEAEGFNCNVVNHACDVIKYVKTYPKISIPGVDNTFKFYTIADLNDRKNVESTIRCFHAAFDRSEPVSLILKVKKFGMNSDQLRQYMDNICGAIKQQARIYNEIDQYHKEIIITQESSEEQIMALHEYADCFVCTSHGEAWSIPTFDAMCMGNVPIASDVSGIREYLDPSLGTLVDGTEVLCRCNDSAFSDLFTGTDYWFQPNEKRVVELMRDRYENRWIDSKPQAIRYAKKFSYEVVGNRMKEILND